jgi:hypothetical protein
MSIDINPSGVMRSADAVGAASQRIASGATAGHPGNDGFTTSAAITQFSSRMHQTSAQAAAETASAAEKLEASAVLMRRVDDVVSDVHRALWSKVV